MVQEMFGVNSMRRAEHITMYIIIMQTQLSQVLVMHRAIHIVIIESMMSHLLCHTTRTTAGMQDIDIIIMAQIIILFGCPENMMMFHTAHAGIIKNWYILITTRKLKLKNHQQK